MKKGSEEDLKEKDQREQQESDESKESELTEEPKYFNSESSQIYAGQPYSRSRKKIPFLFGVAIIIFILGGAFYFLRTRPGSQVEPTPSPQSISPSVEETPSPSPKVSFDRAKYTLRVLNGTSTQGLAASTSAKLKDLGYKIERTDNATNSAFLKTVVRVKLDLKELLANLLKELMPDFEGEEGPQLKDSDTADGEVILGTE